jgi:hypothetical protein
MLHTLYWQLWYHPRQVKLIPVAGNILGVGSMAQTVNVASQYKACSNGKMQIYAATGRNVINGVLSVTISTTVAGSNVLGLQNNESKQRLGYHAHSLRSDPRLVLLTKRYDHSVGLVHFHCA